MDLLSPSPCLIQDLKSCASAHPNAIARSIIAHGYDIQETAYRRAIETLHPEHAGRSEFWFIFFELEPPYSVTPVTLGGSMREIGESRWHRSRETWRRCLEKNEWPGYASAPMSIEAPGWALAQELDLAYSEPMTAPEPARQKDTDNDPADAYF